MVKVSWKVDNPDQDELRYRVFYRMEGQTAWRSALKAGEVQALYAQSPALEGAGAVDALVTYLKANPHAKTVAPMSPLIHFVPTMIITKANVDTPQALQYEPVPTCNA